MENETDIKIGKTFDYVTNVTNVTNVTATGENEKMRFSKKFKCPRCRYHPLELYNFLDSGGNYICDVYVCNPCGTFFRKEECGKR